MPLGSCCPALLTSTVALHMLLHVSRSDCWHAQRSMAWCTVITAFFWHIKSKKQMKKQRMRRRKKKHWLRLVQCHNHCWRLICNHMVSVRSCDTCGFLLVLLWSWIRSLCEGFFSSFFNESHPPSHGSPHSLSHTFGRQQVCAMGAMKETIVGRFAQRFCQSCVLLLPLRAQIHH